MNDARPADSEGILVLGPPRSGTTLLRRLLDAHSRIACPPETGVFTALGRFLHEDPIGEGVKLGPIQGLAFSGIAPDDTIGRLRELAFGLHRDIAKSRGKPRWASKTAWDAFYVDEIELIAGEHARFVCITRNGLDNVCSVQELCNENESFLREIHEYVKANVFPLEGFARMWVDLTERIARFVESHPDRALSIRYEDLVADPKAVMASVFAFLGEADEPAVVERGLARRDDVGFGDFKAYGKTVVDAKSVGRSRSLSPHTQSRLGRIMNPTLIKCGYEPVPIAEERDDEEIRRRYEMGLLLRTMRPRA